MVLPNIFSASDILFATFRFVWFAWPLVLATPLQGRRNYMNTMLVFWLMLAGIRLFIAFDPKPLIAFLVIPEPLSTMLFVVTGAGLVGLKVIASSWHRGTIRQRLSRTNGSSDLQTVSPQQFEVMVVEYFRLQGHRVDHVGMQGDHGIDLVVRPSNGEKWVVQCKRWRSNVGEPALRDFYGAMQHEGATKGEFFTTGRFTTSALQWAKGKSIVLHDSSTFIQEIKRGRKGSGP